jgi:hypothetical protein
MSELKPSPFPLGRIFITETDSQYQNDNHSFEIVVITPIIFSEPLAQFSFPKGIVQAI